MGEEVTARFTRAVSAAEEAKREQVASIEATRLATASARLMEATTRAALVLDRLRNGNRQTVVVQHVAVADGGQAVVAGAVAAGVTGGKGDDRVGWEADLGE